MAVAIASVTETAAASNAFTQTVVRFHGLSTVAVVYSFGPDIDANIDAYEAAYRAAYATYSKFVIVFDARFLGCVPSANTRERKLDLTSSLKWQTTFKVPFVGVLVSNELFASIISELLRARGQAAPLLLTHSADSLARHVVRAAVLSDGRAVRDDAFAKASATTLFAAGYQTVFLCTLVLYLKFMRHHLRPQTL